jgi:hypothetical protein
VRAPRSVEGGASDGAGGPDPQPAPTAGEPPAAAADEKRGETRPPKFYDKFARVFGRNKITTSDRAALLEQLREMI